MAFASLKDNLDLSTPSGRLMFGIIAAMAEFERSLIQERVKAGLSHARRIGKRLGRPRRIVDLEQHHQAEGQGHSLQSIADKLGIGYGTASKSLASIERKTPASGAAAVIET